MVAGIAFVSGRGCLRTVVAELPSLGAGRAAVSRGSGISLGTKVRLAAPFVNVKDIILVAGNCFLVCDSADFAVFASGVCRTLGDTVKFISAGVAHTVCFAFVIRAADDVAGAFGGIGYGISQSGTVVCYAGRHGVCG